MRALTRTRDAKAAVTVLYTRGEGYSSPPAVPALNCNAVAPKTRPEVPGVPRVRGHVQMFFEKSSGTHSFKPSPQCAYIVPPPCPLRLLPDCHEYW